MSTELPDTLAASNLERAIARVVQAMRPEAIYLFGSRARGDSDADSDYDLLVIVPDDACRTRPGRAAGHRSLPPQRLRTQATAHRHA